MIKGTLKGAFVVGALAFAACDDDDSADDARTDAQVDAGNVDAKVPLDAKTDATTNDGGACSLDYSYKVYDDGGLVEVRYVYALSADGRFSRTEKREPKPGDKLDSGVGGASCYKDLPECGSDQLDVGDVRVALSAAAVGAAWGDGSTALGEDQRPFDGPALVFERSDGKKIVLGAACSSQTGCTPIPPAVEALRTLFARLVDEQPLGPQGDGGTAGLCPG